MRILFLTLLFISQVCCSQHQFLKNSDYTFIGNYVWEENNASYMMTLYSSNYNVVLHYKENNNPIIEQGQWKFDEKQNKIICLFDYHAIDGEDEKKNFKRELKFLVENSNLRHCDSDFHSIITKLEPSLSELEQEVIKSDEILDISEISTDVDWGTYLKSKLENINYDRNKPLVIGVSFIIHKDGTMSDYRSYDCPNNTIDFEIHKIVNGVKWFPAEINHIKVTSRKELTIIVN